MEMSEWIVSVCLNGGSSNTSVVVGDGPRLFQRLCAAVHRLVVRLVCVIDVKSYVTNRVAVFANMLREKSIGLKWCAEDDSRLALLQCIACDIAATGLESGVSELRESKTIAVIVCGLFC